MARGTVKVHQPSGGESPRFVPLRASAALGSLSQQIDSAEVMSDTNQLVRFVLSGTAHAESPPVEGSGATGMLVMDATF